MDLDLIEAIRRIVAKTKETPTAEKQSANSDDSSSRFVGTNSLAKLYAKMTPGQISEKFENEKKALKKETGNYGKKGKKDQKDQDKAAPQKDDQDDGAEEKPFTPTDKGAKDQQFGFKFPAQPPGDEEPDDDEEASVDTQAQRAIPTGKTKVIINPELNDPDDDETKTGGVDLSNQPRKKKNKIVKEVLTYQLLKIARKNRIIEQLTQSITDSPLPTPTLPDMPKLTQPLPSGRPMGKTRKFKKKAIPHADNGE